MSGTLRARSHLAQEPNWVRGIRTKLNVSNRIGGDHYATALDVVQNENRSGQRLLDKLQCAVLSEVGFNRYFAVGVLDSNGDLHDASLSSVRAKKMIPKSV